MKGWQPIETAPKDGTKIDLWVHFPEHDEAHRVADAFWDLEDEDWNLHGWLVRQFKFTPQPTHWMPLPEPPPSGRDHKERISDASQASVLTPNPSGPKP